jgi:predicted kinase
LAAFTCADSIEQALRNCGVNVEGEGYVVGYLRLGRIVIADCVNPWPLTRDAWRAVAVRAQVASLDVEVTCSDQAEHRRRVEARVADIPGHQVPTWQDVIDCDCCPWDDQSRLIIDTAITRVPAAVGLIRQALFPR